MQVSMGIHKSHVNHTRKIKQIPVTLFQCPLFYLLDSMIFRPEPTHLFVNNFWAEMSGTFCLEKAQYLSLIETTS